MENEFSFFELLVIKYQCCKAPADRIADMISRPAQEVQDLIDQYALMHGKLTYEDKEDRKEKERKKKEASMRLKANNDKRFSEQEKLAKKQVQHQVTMREVGKIEPQRTERITVKPKKVSKAKQSRAEDEAWLRKKQTINLIQEQAQTRKRRKAEEPKFQMKVVAYSEFTAIRIDAKTVIYAKPGQDPEKVKQKYFDNRQGVNKNLPFNKQV